VPNHCFLGAAVLEATGDGESHRERKVGEIRNFPVGECSATLRLIIRLRGRIQTFQWYRFDTGKTGHTMNLSSIEIIVYGVKQ
jgi:hypothetical protein